MINKTYLHPIKASDYLNSVSLCHVLTCHPPSNKISPYSMSKLSLLISRIFYPPLHSPKNLNSLQLEKKNLGKKLMSRSKFHIA